MALLFIPVDLSPPNLQEDHQLEVLNVAHPEVPGVHQNEVPHHHHHHLEVLLKIMLHILLGSQTHHQNKLLGDSLDAPLDNRQCHLEEELLKMPPTNLDDCQAHRLKELPWDLLSVP